MTSNGSEPGAARAKASRAATDGLVAAIDCGSNSTRLLVTGPDGELARVSIVTGLGRGVQESGLLSAEAIARTVEVLARFRSEIDRHHVPTVRAVSTAASRDAANRDDFLAAAAGVLGVPMYVIDGATEGRYSFAGATGDLGDRRGPFMVIDIGGRSTEVVVGDAEVEGVESLPMGSVGYTERFLHHDPPRPEELSALLSMVPLHLDDVVREHPQAASAATHVGVAGTITTVAAVELGLTQYDSDRIHRFVLGRRAAEDVFRTLATERLADRLHNPGLPPERADVIVAGTAVLVGIMRYFDVAELVVSEHDLLDGVAAADVWPP